MKTKLEDEKDEERVHR